MNDHRCATLYRMVMDHHLCPYGLKSKWLLERKGYAVQDNHLTTYEQTETFKARHGVETTPQTWIGDERIGGYDALREHFGQTVGPQDKTSYQPVVALFTMMALTALGAAWVATGQVVSVHTVEWFVTFSMCGLAYLKLRDVESFSTMFLNYDLLAQRWVPYSYLYPFAEGLAGLLMTAQVLDWVSIPVALFIGTVGASSVLKAVYVDKRELKCACVGGDSNVPLGVVSLTENLFMVGMAVWMLLKPVVS